ncbi:hypothetical protein GCM10023189_10520 [Nibrella saemangeumensis]|uniref:RNA polymerase sigma factor, sigma-70 family n=1 Tax=Nibrella saemangeumensis TaxID=1084526 RepID=A0ABP8MG87_9BACT
MTVSKSVDVCQPFAGNEAAFYEALRAEQRQAFSCLYSRVHNQFVPLACQRGGSYDEALDIMNDCLAIFLQKVRSGEFVFQPDTKITSYLYRICYNQWHNYIDKRQQRREVSFDGNRNGAGGDDGDEEDSSGEPVPLADEAGDEEEQSEWVHRLNRAVALLREDCQKMLHWFYVEELSLREIGERLSMTEASAAVKRFKCAKYLRDRYLSV